MARLLFPTDESWYDELRIISSYYEAELENTLISHIETIFPDYVAIKYKRDVHTPSGGQGRAPDMALIKRDYSDWWIVEVELGHHDLGHVKSQVEVFANGDYNSVQVVKYIKSKDVNNELRIEKLQEMVVNCQPKVLVIVDEHDMQWKETLEQLGALIFIFQVFKSKVGHRAFRLNGHYPFIFESKSHCRFHPSLPNMLEVIDPGWLVDGLIRSFRSSQKLGFFTKEFWIRMLGLESETSMSQQTELLKDKELEVDFLGKISRWKIILSKDKIYLKAIGVNKVDVNSTYYLSCDDRFKIYLRPN